MPEHYRPAFDSELYITLCDARAMVDKLSKSVLRARGIENGLDEIRQLAHAALERDGKDSYAQEILEIVEQLDV